MTPPTPEAKTAQLLIELWLAEKIRAFREAVANLKESASSDHVES